MINNMTTSFSLIASHLLLLLLLAGCSPKTAAHASGELAGTQAERVAAVSKWLGRHCPLPSPLLDAHFMKEQNGDGRLGPSDVKTFYAITVRPTDLPAWKTALSQSKPWNRFSNDDEIKRAAPTKAQPWWVNGADLSQLEFFSPYLLTGRANGWTGIAPDGRIFVFSFTM
jgi:hypothetical protein